MKLFTDVEASFYWRENYTCRFGYVKSRRQFAIRLFNLGLWVGWETKWLRTGE